MILSIVCRLALVLLLLSPGALPVSGRVPPPEVSVPAGFYTESFELELSAGEPGATIHYTLDGSTPTEHSPAYSGPIRIDAPDPTDFVLAGIRSSQLVDESRVDRDWVAPFAMWGMRWRAPASVERGVVVRAMTINGGESSPVVAHSYFVLPEGADRYSLPVVSLATDPGNFFDHETGIYVPGVHESNHNPGRPWHNDGNFRQQGEAWERPIHVEFFENDGTRVLAQNAGVRIHGGATRNFTQKTLRLYARPDYEHPEYGDNWFTYPFFEDNRNRRYKRLLLRNSGNDWPLTLFRDALMQSLVAHLPVDTQSYRPTVVFLNGEYWGIHNLRERYDHHYLAETYGVDEDRLDILSGANGSVDRGGHAHFDALLDFIGGRPTLSDADVDHVSTMMDVDNFLYYMAAQIYFNNTDWPGNNIDYWRLQAGFDPTAAPGHDGRWRWLLYDTDHGFGYSSGPQAYNHNALAGAIDSGSSASRILRALLSNVEVRRKFAIRFANLLNTAFRPERVNAVIDGFVDTLSPEIDAHIARWGQPESRASWDAHVSVLRVFAQHRADQVRNHLRARFGYSGTVALTLGVNRPEAGWVRIEDMSLIRETPGIGTPAQPWTGNYFRDVAIELEARAQTGFRFVKWNDGETMAQRRVTPRTATSLVAEFERDPAPTEAMPAPFPLAGGTYNFSEWPSTAAAGSYPPHMMFLHVGGHEQDPGRLSEPGLPWKAGYALESRSRINGLGTDGISFINTGNAQDLEGTGFVGAAVLALDTRNVSMAFVSWTAATVDSGRPYRLRLQYRTGDALPFRDILLRDGSPVHYDGNESGDTQRFGPIPLPADALGNPYVQLRWHYHALPSAVDGRRMELRLDDILVETARLSLYPESDNGSGTLRVSGPAGVTYALETSQDLVDWVETETFTTHEADASVPVDLPAETGFFRVTPVD